MTYKRYSNTNNHLHISNLDKITIAAIYQRKDLQKNFRLWVQQGFELLPPCHLPLILTPMLRALIIRYFLNNIYTYTIASLDMDPQNKLNTIRHKSIVVAGKGMNLFNDQFLQDSPRPTQKTTCFKGEILPLLKHYDISNATLQNTNSQTNFQKRRPTDDNKQRLRTLILQFLQLIVPLTSSIVPCSFLTIIVIHLLKSNYLLATTSYCLLMTDFNLCQNFTYFNELVYKTFNRIHKCLLYVIILCWLTTCQNKIFQISKSMGWYSFFVRLLALIITLVWHLSTSHH